MDLIINQKVPGCADGNYHVKAKGCIAASLHWADKNGALPDGQSFAYLPYINAGSIRPTALKPDEVLQPECWTEGNVVELLVGENQTTVTGISMKTRQRIARGHYCFGTEKQF